ncbi:Rib/alpha-like domain-containing protein [Lactobacillus sp. ESL0681]|uniref:Rib/alpha-like domain-containing protein n=1 Tax=Lactobacillus sp. ESL0681 TaxID=2983211 RepID=UPI0023F903C4|nr:Rib/alpha-like domain-containing protein [Lactobacillus sp. ESL0681]WEV40796.1 Rib/alpha-like domain-containing protein [Lactobacillus sp. ESL0681]
MLGKNNFDEKLRKMTLQSKRDRFSIRKLTIGAASVLLGFTFMGVNSHEVQAATSESDQTTAKTTTTESSTTNESKPKVNLETYAGLSDFLRGSTTEKAQSAKPQPQQPAKDKTPNQATQTNQAAPTSSPNTAKPSTATANNNDQPTSADQLGTTGAQANAKADNETVEVSDWQGFTDAITTDRNQESKTINLATDITADTENQVYTTLTDITINTNGHTLDIGSNTIQDDYYQWSLTVIGGTLKGSKPNDDPNSFNFFGFNNAPSVTLQDVHVENVSFDTIITFAGNTTVSYDTKGNIFSDYSEAFVQDNANVKIDFNPSSDSTNFICDVFSIGQDAEVEANISNTRTALRGTYGDNGYVEVGENSKFTLNIADTVNFLYRVDPDIPPIDFIVDPGSETHINNSANDQGVVEGKDNQLHLIADTPKLFEINVTNYNDSANFNFPTTDISGDKMGLYSDHYKWIIETSDGANIMDKVFNPDAMTLLKNPSLPEDIPTKGKANQNFKDLSDEADFLDVIENKGGFNSSASFKLGTTLYDSWERTNAGRYNASSKPIAVHEGQISKLGSPSQLLAANGTTSAIIDSSNQQVLTITDLQANGTIKSIEWLPNKAMDASGQLVDNGVVSDSDGTIATGADTKADLLGNAVMRVTYGDGTYDDVPVEVKQVSAIPSDDIQHVNPGQLPTTAQAQAAVAFAGSPDQGDWQVTYEWYDQDKQPLTAAELDQANTVKNAYVKVSYHNADGSSDGEQFVPVKLAIDPDEAHQAGLTAGTGKITVPVNNVGDPATKPVAFSDQKQWKSFLNGDSDNVTQIDWADQTAGNEVVDSIGQDKTATLRVTFHDGSTAQVPGVKFDVVGAQKAAGDATKTPVGTVPTTAQAEEAVEFTSPLADAGYEADYAWAKDAQGTPMTSDYTRFSGTGNAGQQTKDAWVLVTYYAKGKEHTPENVVAKQAVPVDLTLTKKQSNLYHDDLAGSGANGQGTSVAKGTELTDEQAKAAIFSAEELPEGTTYTWGTTADTTTTGNKEATVKVTYPDGTSELVPVLVNVYDTAEKATPVGQLTTAEQNGAAPDAKTAIANAEKSITDNNKQIDKLPADAQYEWLYEPDLSQSGITVDAVKITYADGSVDTVVVPIQVGDGKITGEHDPKGKLLNLKYTSNGAATADDAEAAIANADTMPKGSSYAWKQAPVVNDLNQLGQQPAIVTVTYPDNSTQDVPVIVNVTSNAKENVRPRAQNICLEQGSTVPEDVAQAAITNVADLHNVKSYEVEQQISTDKSGVTANVIKVTYNDGSYEEVPVQVIIDAKNSADDSKADKSRPHVKTLRVGLGSKPAARKIIDNFNDLRGNPKAEWVDPNFPTQATKTPGLKQSQVKLTYDDGSTKIVTGYLRVMPDGEKRVNTATGKTTNKKIGDAVTAADMVDNLPKDATASFVSPINIENGETVAAGTYPEIIKVNFHDGSTKLLTGVLTVDRNEADQDITQTTPIVLHVESGTSTQPVTEFTDPSTFLADPGAGDVATVEWAEGGQPEVSQANDQATGTIKLTFNDGTSKQVPVEVKVLGAKKATKPVPITQNAKLDQAHAKAALNADDVHTLDAQYPGIKYSWAANADGTGAVSISEAGEQSPYVVITYPDGTKQVVQVDLKVNEAETDGGKYHPETGTESITIHKADKGKVAVPEFTDSSKFSGLIEIPNLPAGTTVADLVTGLDWVDGAPDAIGDNKTAKVMAHFEDGSASYPFKIKVNVIGAQSADKSTKIAVSSKLTTEQAKAALTPESVAEIEAKYPGVTYDWASQPNGTGRIKTGQEGSPDAYVVVNYPDHTLQTVKVDLQVVSQAASYDNELSLVDTAAVTMHVASDEDATVPVKEFTDLNWIKDNIKLDNEADSSKKIKKVIWKTEAPDISASDIGQQVHGRIKIVYKDGSTSTKSLSLPVNVIGGQAQADPTTVVVGTDLTPEQAQNALTTESITAIKAKYPKAEFSWAAQADGSGQVDTSKTGAKTAYVVVDYGDGTNQIVAVPLTVNSKDSGSSVAGTTEVTPIGGVIAVDKDTNLSNDTDYAQQAISNHAQLPAGTTYKWAKVPDTSQVGTITGTVIVTNPNGDAIAVTVTLNITAKQSEQVTLRHNAYLYNANGQRINELILKTGSIVNTYGVKQIADRDFYILNNNYYLATGNVQSVKRKLIHNAYTYNEFGKRLGKTTTKKGKVLATYGEPVKISGQKYYIVGANRYVKAANFKKAKHNIKPAQQIKADPQKDQIMHSSYLYDEKGQRVNEVTLKAGSRVKVDKTIHRVGARKFYQLDNGYYIAKRNITGDEVVLNHNAYVYNKYGKRANQKVLKRGSTITVYGDWVSLQGTRYWIIGKGRYVKAANL